MPPPDCRPVSRLEALAGHSLIYGDSQVASTLAQQLAASGGRATIVPASADLNTLLARCDQLLASDLPQHLILVSSRQRIDAGSPATWRQMQASLLVAPFQLCQRLGRRDYEGQCGSQRYAHCGDRAGR